MNTMQQETKPIFECWAVVEIFGHQQLAGRVSEQTIAGQGFVRVDVPDLPDQPGFTRMFGPGAIYSIIPTTQEIATAYAAKNVAAPIKSWQLQHPQLPNLTLTDRDDDETAGYDPGAALEDDEEFGYRLADPKVEDTYIDDEGDTHVAGEEG